MKPIVNDNEAGHNGVKRTGNNFSNHNMEKRSRQVKHENDIEYSESDEEEDIVSPKESDIDKNCSSEEDNKEESCLDPETGLLLNPHTETIPFTSQEPGICQMATSLEFQYTTHFPYTPKYEALRVTSKQDYEKGKEDQEINDLLTEYVHKKFNREEKSHEMEDHDLRIKNVHIYPQSGGDIGYFNQER